MDSLYGSINTQLIAKAFLYDAYRGLEPEQFSEPFQLLLQMMPVLIIPAGKVYRSRTIDLDADVDSGKGITKINDHLAGGFTDEESWVPPIENCKLQRLNRAGEQVLYVAENYETAVREQKAQLGQFVSVAEYEFKTDIPVFDFAAYTHVEQQCIITGEFQKAFYTETELNARQLYFEVQKFLSIMEPWEGYYKVSNALCDLMKKDDRVWGVRYFSSNNGYNLGIWKYEKIDRSFVRSSIVEVNESLQADNIFSRKADDYSV